MGLGSPIISNGRRPGISHHRPGWSRRCLFCWGGVGLYSGIVVRATGGAGRTFAAALGYIPNAANKYTYTLGATLKIIILPPFWKTSWAYALYVVLLAVTLLLARRMVLRRARVRFALENERRETRRMHEMDVLKIRFFTNMSHELRTPLSLILAPVDKLLARPAVADPRQRYEMIRRNARRL